MPIGDTVVKCNKCLVKFRVGCIFPSTCPMCKSKGTVDHVIPPPKPADVKDYPTQAEILGGDE